MSSILTQGRFLETFCLYRAGKKHSNYQTNAELLCHIVGSVVEFLPATRETGVRFPDNADFSLKTIIEEKGIFLTIQLDLALLVQ